MTAQMKRPLGVTILAILNVIGGIIMIVGGLVIIAVAAFVPNLSSLDEEAAEEFESEMMMEGLSPEMFGPVVGSLGGISIALGIASLIVAFGLFKGKGWAWTISMILAFIGIAMAVVFLALGQFGNIVSIVINGIILYYLFRPHVKAYFGKGTQPQPQQSPAPP